MASSAVWKIPFILANSACLRVAMTPPTPYATAASKERARYEREHATRDLIPMPLWWGPPTFRTTGHAINGLEILAIILSAYPSIVEYLAFGGLVKSANVARDGSNIYISATFVIGLVLSVFGAWIRASCYRHMGRHFTFELTIQDEHKLITHGPYAIVRHPSYFGLFTYYFGTTLCQFGPGSFWDVAGLWGTLAGKLAGVFYIGYMIWVAVALFARAAKEDDVLRREFKDQWHSWAQKTPYRLLPFIY
ncbi:hypothetical protein NM688_g302 [Phlebia brevispora]|uniref:Uncharacterized protein n=1 Tax=Phlebia brevispora TaxID=194682 RepID=A0ACC1TF08_9APHY|nr:hypothetical protein NM688_g302 [Phlebia brevispora]